ncbi:MAG: nicotinate (nicotinamide) nucleotide adenylyltransferase [Luteibaculum sp.]
MNIALFFGSFNPVHIGHMIIADYVRQHSPVNQIWFVLTPQNPHKKQSNLLDDYTRLEMLNLAIEDDPNLRVSDIEFKLPKPSYTATTLAYLKEKFPEYRFYLTIGEDNLYTLHKWQNSDVIIRDHPVIFYPRMYQRKPEEAVKFLEKAELLRCEAPKIQISSSFVRKEIAAGNSVRYALPEKVWRFLEGSNIYRK